MVGKAMAEVVSKASVSWGEQDLLVGVWLFPNLEVGTGLKNRGECGRE